MKKLLVACASLVWAVPLVAQRSYQPGFIIDLKGDTLRGTIQYRNWDKNPSAIAFKQGRASRPNIYRPTNIRAFFVNHEWYESAFVNVDTSAHKITELNNSSSPEFRKDSVFLFSLIRGEKSLFYLKDKNGKSHFFIDSHGIKALIFKEYVQYLSSNTGNSDRKAISNNSEYRSQLADYLKDCRTIEAVTGKLKYEKSSLLELFKKYYSCTSKSSNFRNERREVGLQTGILAGTSLSHLTFDIGDLPRSESGPMTNLSGGFFADWKLLRTRGLDIAQDLFVTTTKTEVVGYRPRTTTYDTVTSHLNYSHFKTTHQLRFNLLRNSGLYISGGISVGLMVDKRSTTAKSLNYISTDDSQSTKFIIGRVATLGYRLGRVSAEARLERCGLSGASVIYWKHIFLRCRIW